MRYMLIPAAATTLASLAFAFPNSRRHVDDGLAARDEPGESNADPEALEPTPTGEWGHIDPNSAGNKEPVPDWFSWSKGPEEVPATLHYGRDVGSTAPPEASTTGLDVDAAGQAPPPPTTRPTPWRDEGHSSVSSGWSAVFPAALDVAQPSWTARGRGPASTPSYPPKSADARFARRGDLGDDDEAPRGAGAEPTTYTGPAPSPMTANDLRDDNKSGSSPYPSWTTEAPSSLDTGAPMATERIDRMPESEWLGPWWARGVRRPAPTPDAALMDRPEDVRQKLVKGKGEGFDRKE